MKKLRKYSPFHEISQFSKEMSIYLPLISPIPSPLLSLNDHMKTSYIVVYFHQFDLFWTEFLTRKNKNKNVKVNFEKCLIFVN